MAIGDLYNAQNVVTGQAAVFVAPGNTPLIDLSKFNTADPFDTTAWTTYSMAVGATTAVILTFLRRGVTASTTSLTITGLTAAALQAALNGLATIGAGGVNVTGTTTTGPFFISFDEGLQDGVLTAAFTGTGGVLSAPLWTACGATEQGWQLGADKSTQSINIEEQSTQVGTTITSQAVSVQGSLSEDITRTLALAMNATVTKTAAVTTVSPGYDTLTLTDTVLVYALGLVTTNAEGFGRIVYAPLWTSLGNVSASFRRAAGQRLYGVNFATICATNQIQILNFTQPK